MVAYTIFHTIEENESNHNTPYWNPPDANEQEVLHLHMRELGTLTRGLDEEEDIHHLKSLSKAEYAAICFSQLQEPEENLQLDFLFQATSSQRKGLFELIGNKIHSLNGEAQVNMLKNISIILSDVCTPKNFDIPENFKTMKDVFRKLPYMLYKLYNSTNDKVVLDFFKKIITNYHTYMNFSECSGDFLELKSYDDILYYESMDENSDESDNESMSESSNESDDENNHQAADEYKQSIKKYKIEKYSDFLKIAKKSLSHIIFNIKLSEENIELITIEWLTRFAKISEKVDYNDLCIFEDYLNLINSFLAENYETKSNYGDRLGYISLVLDILFKKLILEEELQEAQLKNYLKILLLTLRIWDTGTNHEVDNFIIKAQSSIEKIKNKFPINSLISEKTKKIIERIDEEIKDCITDSSDGRDFIEDLIALKNSFTKNNSILLYKKDGAQEKNIFDFPADFLVKICLDSEQKRSETETTTSQQPNLFKKQKTENDENPPESNAKLDL